MAASAGTSSLGRLLSGFVRGVTGVAHAAVMAADGGLVAKSDRLPWHHAEHLSTVAGQLQGVAATAARNFSGGAVHHTMIEMDHGYLLLMPLRQGGCLVALAAPSSDIGTVAYEMTVLVDRLDAQVEVTRGA